MAGGTNPAHPSPFGDESSLPRLVAARSWTIRLAQLMLDEVTDWRIVHQGPDFIPA